LELALRCITLEDLVADHGALAAERLHVFERTPSRDYCPAQDCDITADSIAGQARRLAKLR
jgi:hypothetical protein